MLAILNSALPQREYFDPENKRHLAEVKYFIDNDKWRNVCPFHLEAPFIEIPAMIATKFLVHKLK